VSGESGAAGLGALLEVLINQDHAGFRQALGLDATSRVLLFSTEGDTDPDMYRRIVWDGAYPAP
ncbi:MAG: diaminopropionate ammonia-lyase, partial [Planctomycetes bacterium]|nr:diaminopropionate ammonia-lyase [Planctomycetota bacterium]